eukprot:2277471-Pyramimonas_sp.AAC.2
MEFRMPEKFEVKEKHKKTKTPKASEWNFVDEGDKSGTPSGGQPKSLAQVRASKRDPFGRPISA